MTFFLAFLFLAVMLSSAGQIVLKLSTTSDVWAFPGLPMFNILFFAAAFLYFASMLLYTSALKGLPITIAYPSMALSYVLVAGVSHAIWKTPFGVLEFVAFALILIALALLAYSNANFIGT